MKKLISLLLIVLILFSYLHASASVSVDILKSATDVTYSHDNSDGVTLITPALPYYNFYADKNFILQPYIAKDDTIPYTLCISICSITSASEPLFKNVIIITDCSKYNIHVTQTEIIEIHSQFYNAGTLMLGLNGLDMAKDITESDNVSVTIVLSNGLEKSFSMSSTQKSSISNMLSLFKKAGGYTQNLQCIDSTFPIEKISVSSMNSPTDADAKLMLSAIDYLESNSMIVTSRAFEKSSDDDGTTTFHFSICNGVDFRVSYRDGSLLSYMASIDPNNTYAKNRAYQVFSSLLMSVEPSLKSSDANEILEYLAANLTNDEDMMGLGTKASIWRFGYDISLFKTDYTVILGIYPIQE